MENLPTYIHVSLQQSTKPTERIHLPVKFRMTDPTLEKIAVKKMKSIEKGYEDASCLHGYLFFAYKTMEDMHTTMFTSSWKTWSGARMLYSKMPEDNDVSKLSFYKRVSGNLNFEYILIAKIRNMMLNAAPALNVLHYMKPKVCAYVGAYRKIPFEVNRELCECLGLQDANYADALTTKMRVIYSNNTGYVQLSDHIEFRCKDEEEEKEFKKKNPTKRNTEVQTDPPIARHTKRTLPRTLSSFPVPGTSSIRETEIEAGYSIPSPEYIIHNIMEHKHRIVKIGDHCLLVLDNRDLVVQPQTRAPIVDISPKRDSPNAPNLGNNQNMDAMNMNYTAPSTSRIMSPIAPIDDGALLRRLKTQYFNSPEYTAAELCSSTSL
ncbi:unnamed protein product [Caenorhabditis bovis]|uniref:DUF7153 domain-containing protein n=1 Tax=Caenorhabditis bovis TaxID=2654633 RepID=A0A8S1EI87_9PELO|nr:unnamed protein product [Caenorhabditis bovis]